MLLCSAPNSSQRHWKTQGLSGLALMKFTVLTTSSTPLKLWELGYVIFVLWNWPKTSSCQLPYQRPSCSANCAKELFKGSNESASLLDCTQKNFWLGLRIFYEWRHKWSSFWAILAHVAWPRAQPLGGSILLKFSLQTRLESKSFKPLINFLAFPVQKLWSKIKKLINYLIN